MTVRTTVRVRDLRLPAEIGIRPDERGRRQPLVISVTAELHADRIAMLEDSLDYRAIAAAASAVAENHVGLIEVFARDLGERCLTLGPVAAITVDVEKPEALADAVAGVSVRIEATR